MNKGYYQYFIFILLFILGVLICNYTWFQEDDSIEGSGAPNHVGFSIEFFYKLSDIINEKSLTLGSKVNQIVYLLGNPVKFSCVEWPNGLNTTASVFYYLFGKSLFSAKLSLMPYLIILLLSTYLIGRTLFSDFVGLLAMFLLYMYPLIFESFRQFQLDSPLTAMVALSILFLIKGNDFKSRKYSLLLGVSLGWGMLVKGQAILYIIGPLCFVLYRACRHCWVHPLRSKQLQNIGIFMLLSVMIASLWWGHQIGETINKFGGHIFSERILLESYWSYGEKYSFDSISYYMRELFFTLGLPLYIAFFISLLIFLKQKVNHKGILMSWFIPPLLAFSFVFTIKQPRFLMPVFPFMALITAWGLAHIKSKKVRLPIVSVVIVFCIMQFYALSYWNYHKRNISIGIFEIFGRTLYEIIPYAESQGMDEIVQTIREHIPLEQSVKVGSINIATGRPHTLSIIFWLRVKDKYLDPVDLTEMHEQFLKDFDVIDFILFCRNNGHAMQWPEGDSFQILLAEKSPDKVRQVTGMDGVSWATLLRLLEKNRSNFDLVRKVSTERSVYYIYKRNKKLLQDSSVSRML